MSDSFYRIILPNRRRSSGVKSKHEPDASFYHRDARYPGVIIEVAYLQTKKKLGRLAKDYLLDLDIGV